MNDPFERSGGPQVSFDKNYLCMMTKVCQVKQDQVTMKNTGSTTITYEWNKIHRGDFIQAKNSDGIQRFYCHYPRDSLKPGESKTFIFTFRSEKPGMFNEEWELLTEPQLLQQAPLLYLSGMATQEDAYAAKREALNAEFEREIIKMGSSDIVEDIVAEVRTPQEKRDLEFSSRTEGQKFEAANERFGLHFDPLIYNSVLNLFDQVVETLEEEGSKEPIESFEATYEIDYIEELITRVQSPHRNEGFQRLYNILFNRCKKVPIEQALSFDIFKDVLERAAEDIIDVEEKVRKDMGLVENVGFYFVDDEHTEEEAAALIEDVKNKKAEAAKKIKQKPKTEEEEAAEAEALVVNVAKEVAERVCGEREGNSIGEAERQIDLQKTRNLLNDHKVMEAAQYDCLNRKLSVYDIELGAKDIILRLDLDVPLSPFVPPAKATEGISLKSVEQPAGPSAGPSIGKNSNFGGRNKSELDSQVSVSPLGAEEDYWKSRQILDHSWVKRTVQELRMCMERMANRIFVIGNLGDKVGRIKGENSMRLIQNELQQHIQDIPVHFLSSANRTDIAQKKEEDELFDNCIYVVENLNFHPEEFGVFVPPPEDPEAKAREGADLEDKPDTKEETGGKEASKSKKDEKSKGLEEQMSKSGVGSPEHQKENEDDAEVEKEPFNKHTIQQFKKNLGTLGEVYINDAPLASLSDSNSVAEVSIGKKVMGMTMSQEVRKLAQFFMKQFPLDINSIYCPKPDPNLEYFTYKSMALIGGATTGVTDLISKILLVNSFVDTFSRIFLVGEVGLSALYALGVSPGIVERSEKAHEEYEAVREFWVKVFNKSVEKDCELKFPIDFVCAKPEPLEDILQDKKGVAPVDSKGDLTKDKQTTEQTGGSKKSAAEIEAGKNLAKPSQLDVSEIQNLGSEELQRPDLLALGPNFKPNHWTDAQIYFGRTEEVDLEAVIRKNFVTLTERARRQREEQLIASQIKFRSHDSSAANLRMLEQSLKEVVSQNSNVEKEKTNAGLEESHDATSPDGPEATQSPDEPKIPKGHTVVCFGPKTVDLVQTSLKKSFKLFWNGSVSIYSETAVSANNNKEVLNTLLDLRTKSHDHEEPPVTLLHGKDTEKLLRSTLMRIKIEQQEALDAKKRAAEEQQNQQPEEDEEGLSMEDDDMDLGEQSEEKISTFQEDLEIITDFSCFEATEFTTHLMSGLPIPSILSFGEHTKPSKEQEEEDLKILDEI